MHICVPQKKIYSLLNDHRTLNRFQWSSYSPSGCMHLAFFGIQDKSIWKEDRNHLYPRCYVGVMGFSAMPRSKTKTPSHASKPTMSLRKIRVDAVSLEQERSDFKMQSENRSFLTIWEKKHRKNTDTLIRNFSSISTITSQPLWSLYIYIHGSMLHRMREAARETNCFFFPRL